MELVSQMVEPLFVYNGAGVAFPTGIVDWSDMGAVLVWFVVVAFIGSMLGILRERTSGHRAEEPRRAHVADEHLEQAA